MSCVMYTYAVKVTQYSNIHQISDQMRCYNDECKWMLILAYQLGKKGSLIFITE